MMGAVCQINTLTYYRTKKGLNNSSERAGQYDANHDGLLSHKVGNSRNYRGDRYIGSVLCLPLCAGIVSFRSEKEITEVTYEQETEIH